MTEKQPPKLGDDILETLDQIGDYLEWAQAQIQNNVEVDLAGLDYSIEDACKVIKDSPQHIKDEAEPKMTIIVEQLEKLAVALRDHPMVAEDAADDLSKD